MQFAFEKYIGIHPGLILDRELKKRNVKKRPFAISIGEYPQLINEVTKGRRGVTPSLSLKIDDALGLQSGTLYLLQAHYDLEKARESSSQNNTPSFRSALFWDTDMSKIDWKKQYKAVIKRVFERGNEEEKLQALRYYGQDKVREITGKAEGTNYSIPIMGRSKDY
jgi:plasmid maintenance system antidote protein VapI